MQGSTAPRRKSAVLVVVAILIALAVPVGLWAHYGPTVFFETIRVGFVACFG
jgi:hypothetical protein